MYNYTNTSIIGVQQIPYEETDKYGIVNPSVKNGKLYRVNEFVEKPSLGTALSNLGIIGRYILTPAIFEHLSEHKIGTGGEIQLTDAIEKLNKREKVYAFEFEGERYDVGDTLGFIKTTIDIALKRKDLRDPFLKYLSKVNEFHNS